ncbi:acyltransferase [uncultured Clostridium sp.]|uniref:acyltransferase n=1 Tax=uncultured Clostridium sp. TaxID=59620 RepID=UPI00280B0149|nr:acyltransferase [uncultured Clostridium sp.]
MSLKSILKDLLTNTKFSIWGIKEYGKGCYIGARSVLNCKNAKLKFGNNVTIGKDNLIYNIPNSKIEIGDNSIIGPFSCITSYNYVKIGRNIITGPNVYITDYNHRYDKIGVPIKDQGVVCEGNKVVIDDDVWIATNCVIVGNVNIGKGAVIGANSVVTKDIPEYCVAVGNPCKIIKKYDVTTQTWKRVK